MNVERFNHIREVVETTCCDSNTKFDLASIKSNGKYSETDKVCVWAFAQITLDEATKFLNRLTGKAEQKVKQPKRFSLLSFFFSFF